jgi:hypothetical protein
MYQRIIPRDLFNEAKLLKCLGQLALIIHDAAPNGIEVYGTGEFRIDQRRGCGGLYVCSGINFRVKSLVLDLYTAYNSKEEYPLLCDTGNGEIAVFNGDGTLTEEFLVYLGKPLGWV